MNGQTKRSTRKQAMTLIGFAMVVMVTLPQAVRADSFVSEANIRMLENGLECRSLDSAYRSGKEEKIIHDAFVDEGVFQPGPVPQLVLRPSCIESVVGGYRGDAFVSRENVAALEAFKPCRGLAQMLRPEDRHR